MRDRRLDFWRGLCLIDMVLVHLVHEGIPFGALAPLIVDYTRFAAGGFVLVAGLGVGLVFRERAASARIVWRRAGYLLGVHYALTGVIIALDVLRGLRPPATEPLGLVRDIVWLREAPAYVDVLPLYVVMLLVTPLLFALLRRGLWPIIAAASLVLFAWGRHDPQALSPPGSVEFPFLLWQTFFVAGLLFSVVVPRLDRSRRGWPVAMVTSWLAFAVLTALAYGPRFGWLDTPSFVTFTKVPLTTGELGRYLAATFVVITTSAVGWRHVQNSTTAAVVTLLGRRSLAVYGAHVFVQMAVVAAAARLWWMGDAQGLVVAVPTLAILWALAQAFELRTTYRTQWRAARRILESWVAPPAGIAIAALLIATLGSTSVPANRTELALDAPPAAVVPDVAADAPGIELVDALADPTTNVSQAPDTLDSAPAASTLDDAPIQSGLTTPFHAA